METFLFDHAEWRRLYMNCSQFGTTLPLTIPWEQRAFIVDAIAMILMATIYYILYIPCMFSLRKHTIDENGERNSCYTLLYVIGWVDMTVLWGITYFMGILFLNGAVYCTAPLAICLIGYLTIGFAMVEIVADVVLALNRCLDILSPTLANMLFGGKRVWLWVFGQFSFGLYYLWFQKPVLYNGMLVSATLNPYHGFWDDVEGNFKDAFLAFSQFILVFSTPTIYTIFAVALWLKTQYYRSYGGGGNQVGNSSSMTRNQFLVFMQIALISLVNTLAGGSYYVLEHFLVWLGPSSLFVTTRLAHYCWINMHGLPPVLYILLNKTVRKDIRNFWTKLFKPYMKKRIGANSQSKSNAIQPATAPSHSHPSALAQQK